MLAESIREQTRQNHQILEKLLVSRLKSMRSEQDYVFILQMFYGYFTPVEEMVNAFIGSKLPDANQRRKASALMDDLHYFNQQPGGMAAKEEIPVIGNYLEAYGALYVMEGSTLGGKIISQMVTTHLNLKGDNGVRFFNGYGTETGPMWEIFKEHLNKIAKDKDEEDMVIHAADQTFLKFKDWIVANTSAI